MGDEFHINEIGNFYNYIEPTEISDVSKIIRKMITIKNSSTTVVSKHTKPYTVTEKIELNHLSKNIAKKITKYHLDSYDVIDDAISCLEEYERSIREDLYDFYWDIYFDILIEMDIDSEDYLLIRQNSSKIYVTMLKNIKTQLFDGKKSDIPADKIKTYIGAIAAYVFYKCKFLIPIQT